MNRVASHTLAVYLIHDNEYLRRWLWWEFFGNSGLADSWLLPLHALAKVALVFALCVGVDALRAHTLGRRFELWLGKLFDRCVTRVRAVLQKRRVTV